MRKNLKLKGKETLMSDSSREMQKRQVLLLKQGHGAQVKGLLLVQVHQALPLVRLLLVLLGPRCRTGIQNDAWLAKA